MGFVETLSFQQIVKQLFMEGIVPVPRTFPALCDGVVLPYLDYGQRGDATAAGAEELRAVAQEER